jgi:hypothetical protein
MADEFTVIIDDTGLGVEFGTTPFIANTTLSEPAYVPNLSDIGDVDTAILNNGALLVYKTTTQKWTSTTTLEAQNLEGGFY